MLRQFSAFSAAALVISLSAADAVSQQAVASNSGRALTLPAAIEMAQRQGARARAARHTLDAARASFGAYSARQLPQVSLNGDVPSYNRSIIPAPQPDGSLQFRPTQQTNSSLNMFISQNIALTGGTIGVSSQLAQLKRTGAPETWSSTPFSIQLVQPILRSNSLKWTRAEQGLNAELAERSFDESMEDVALGTATAFIGLYSANAMLRAATENIERSEALRAKVKIRVGMGAVSNSDVRQAELAYLRAQMALSQATLARDEADATLRAMLGVSADAEIDLAWPGEPPAVNPDTTTAIAAALRNRSDAIVFELQDTRARRAESEARFGFDNGIGATLVARYGYNATAGVIGDVYQDLQEQQQFRLSVSAPVWQWGAASADREAARAMRSAITASAQDARDQIRRDVVFTIRRLAQARYSLAIAAQADTVAVDRMRDATVRYDFGSIPIESLFLALNDRDQVAQQGIAALQSFWTEYYRLRRVTMHNFETGQPIR